MTDFSTSSEGYADLVGILGEDEEGNFTMNPGLDAGLDKYTIESFEELFGARLSQSEIDQANTVEGRLEGVLLKKWELDNAWSEMGWGQYINTLDPFSGNAYEYRLDEMYVNLLTHLKNKHNKGILLHEREGTYPKHEIVSLSNPRMKDYYIPKAQVRGSVASDFWTAWYAGDDAWDKYWEVKKKARIKEIAADYREDIDAGIYHTNVSSGQSGSQVQHNIRVGGHSSTAFDYGLTKYDKKYK